MKKIANGVYKLSLGASVEDRYLRYVPFHPSENMGLYEDCDSVLSEEDFSIQMFNGRIVVRYKADCGEDFYGLGLMLKKVLLTKSRKRIKVNADPTSNNGDSHAPVPFFISPKGYGILIDSVRPLTVCFGNNTAKRDRSQTKNFKNKIVTNTAALYFSPTATQEEKVISIETQESEGINLYVINGKDVKEVVAKYNLLFGGGALPSLWGLGVLYRTYGVANSTDVKRLAHSLRKDGIPCDVIGLEPGWQTNVYSCSYVVDQNRYPDFYEMKQELLEEHYHLNLWEHAFVHGSSPLYKPLYDLSGDFEVWEGLVPDFTLSQTREIFAEYHLQHYIRQGIDGVKIDECDDSDNTNGWSFLSTSVFPSGLDGEEMHTLFGEMYARVFEEAFQKEDLRHFSQVRSLGLGASSHSFCLYSDLYNHWDFLRGILSSAFSGLLWSPEVRQCESEEELIRRLELVSLSPMCLINAWMIPNEPWKQYDEKKNIAGEFLPNCERLTAKCRKILERRMSLLPYLYNAYYQYQQKGIPPFRPLVFEYPDDDRARKIETEFFIGDELLFAPFIYKVHGADRKVYLPRGVWYDFYTGKRFEGEQEITISAKDDEIPLFVKEGGVIPYAKPLQYTTSDTLFEVELRCFGERDKLRPCCFFSDDGVSYAYLRGEYSIQNVSVGTDGQYIISNSGKYPSRYTVTGIKYF